MEITHRLDETVEWFANYTYTNAEVKEHEEESKVGAKINFVPQNAIGAGVHLTFPQGLRATVTVQSYSGIYQDINKDSAPLDGYILVNSSSVTRTSYKRLSTGLWATCTIRAGPS